MTVKIELHLFWLNLNLRHQQITSVFSQDEFKGIAGVAAFAGLNLGFCLPGSGQLVWSRVLLPVYHLQQFPGGFFLRVPRSVKQ